MMNRSLLGFSLVGFAMFAMGAVFIVKHDFGKPASEALVVEPTRSFARDIVWPITISGQRYQVVGNGRYSVSKHENFFVSRAVALRTPAGATICTDGSVRLMGAVDVATWAGRVEFSECSLGRVFERKGRALLVHVVRFTAP